MRFCGFMIHLVIEETMSVHHFTRTKCSNAIIFLISHTQLHLMTFISTRTDYKFI